MIPENFIRELLDKTEIENLISGYVKLTRKGANLTGLCPFHSEKTPSFTVFVGGQNYYCFGCGAGGDAITFTRQIENLDYVDAIRFLADKTGMTVPEESGGGEEFKKLRDNILAMNRVAAQFFHESLNKSEVAKDYTNNRRLSQNTITKFGIGYAADSWSALCDQLRSKGFLEPDIVKAGLARVSEKGHIYDYFRNRLMFPIIDVRGNVVAFGGRIIGDGEPKYLNSPDTPVFKKSNNLYSLNLAKSANKGRLILAEGYMDVVALASAGFTEAVATLGTALTSEQARLASRYTKEVIIAYDSDEAGIRATSRAISILGEVGLKVNVLRISGAKDPDEYVKIYGREKMSKLLSGSESFIDYKIALAASRYNLENSADKVEYIKEVAEILAQVNSPVEIDVYASRVAKEVGIDKDSMLSEVSKLLRKSKKKYEKKLLTDDARRLTEGNWKINPEKSANLRAARAEEGIICLLFYHSNLYEHIRDKLTEDDFLTSFNKKVFEMTKNRIEREEIPHLSIFSELPSAENSAVVGILINRDKLAGTKEELLEFTNTLLELGEKRRLKSSIDDDAALLAYVKGKNK